MYKEQVVISCSFSTLKKIHKALDIALRAKKFSADFPYEHDEADEREYQANMRKAIREGEALAFELFYAGAEQIDPSGRLALGF